MVCQVARLIFFVVARMETRAVGSVAIRDTISEDVEIFFPSSQLNGVEIGPESFGGGAGVDIVRSALVEFSVGETVHGDESRI